MSRINFDQLDLNLLRAFDTVMDERSVTRAAARLNLTQSAVSHALNKLRHVVADELFVRDPNGMQPTERASQMGPTVREALLRIRQALSPVAFEPRTSDRQFQVLTSEYVSAVLLPDVVARLREASPAATLVIRPLGTVDIVEELDAGRIDLAIGVFKRMPSRFRRQLLFRDRGVWVMRADHPAACRRPTLGRITRLPQMARTLTGSAAEARGEVMRQHGLERQAMTELPALAHRTHVSIPHMLAVPSILARTDLVILLPRLIARTMAKMHPLALFDPKSASTSFDVTMLWHERAAERADLNWLRAQTREVAARLQAARP